MSPQSVKAHRTVHVPKGQTLEVHAGGVVITIERFASNAVHVRNANNGRYMRVWSPKEAKEGG